MALARYRVEILSLLLLLLVIAGLGILFLDRHLDRSFITYRIAENVAAGRGFAYNPGESEVFPEGGSPIFALLLNGLMPFSGNLPVMSNITGVIAVVLGSLALYGMAHPAGKLAAGIAAALYAVFPLLWIALGLDTTVWMGLCLLGVWLYEREWAFPSALILALATLMRPEAASLIVVLAAGLVATGRPFKPFPAGLYLLLVMIGAFWMIDTFGRVGPLPGAQAVSGISGTAPSNLAGESLLAGLSAVAASFMEASPLWVALPVLGLAGILRLREQTWAAVLTGWAALHLITLGVLGTAVYAWDFAPLLPALAALAALGIAWLIEQIRVPGAPWAMGAIGGVVLASAAAQTIIVMVEPLPAGHTGATDILHPARIEAGDADAGAWLLENTAPEARVGVTHSGLLGYTSQRIILDTHGALHAAAAGLPPVDPLSWLAYYAPDYLVLRESEVADLNGYAASADPWFASTYIESARFPSLPESEVSESIVIYRRISEPRPITDALFTMVPISDQLTLNRIGTDFPLDPLEGGRLGLVTIQWLVQSGMQGEHYVAIRIQNRDGTVAALGGRMLDFSGWPTQTLITSYHPVEIAPALTPGVYDIVAGIGVDPLQLTWYPVALAKVPFQNTALLGGLSGARSQFGEIELIGYRLNRTPEGLDVLLLWQAAEDPKADYKVLIQVRDVIGNIVSQVETPPANGSYPTSVWSKGEQVPDTYRVEISALPPGDYEVYAGLIDPDGARLLTLNGQDAVLIGRLTIAPE